MERKGLNIWQKYLFSVDIPESSEGATRTLIQQQEVVADLGQQALEGDDLDQLFYDASEAVAATLDHNYCKVLDLLPGGNEVFLRQGVGWRDGLVGSTTVPTDLESQAGYTLFSEEPVVVTDLRTEDRFSGPVLLTSHDVKGGISVIIGSIEEPWGILGTHTTESRTYTKYDVNFVQNVANILAQAIAREQREQELRTEKNRFQQLVQSVDEYAIFMLDPDGHVVSWNEGAEHIKGYQEDEILGEHFSAFYPDDARENGVPKRNLEQAAANGSVTDEGWRIREDGTNIWADVTTTALRDDEGELRGFTKVTRDLTDQREREQTLQRERELLETNPTGILVIDSDGEIVRANTQAGELYDRDPDALRGDDYKSFEGEIIDEVGDPLAVDESPVGRVFATGEPVYDELIGIEQADGIQKWLSASAAPIHGPDGSIKRVVTAAMDVTNRREREQRLRAFQEALDHAGHAIYLTETDGTIEYVNAAFEEQTGYSAAEAIGETPHILDSGEHSKAFYSDLWGTILSGEVWTGEVINQSKSGETYTINQTIAPILDRDGNIERFIAVNADMTERKKRERTLERQRNTLERLRQITGSLNSIHTALIRASSRKDLDQLVCDSLGSSEAYVDAWIGEYVTPEEAIEPRAWTGLKEADLSKEVDALNEEQKRDGITERAIQTGEVQAAQNLFADPSGEVARDHTRRQGYNAAAAVPLMYGSTVYGVLCLHSTRSFAFDESERQLLGELGERIGHAIHAIKNRQLLHADTRIELEFHSRSATSFVSVSEQLECRLSIEKTTPANEGALVYYTDVAGAPPEDVCAQLETFSEIDHARVLQATGDTGTIECRITDSCMVLTLTESGATLQSAVIENGEAAIVAETAAEANTRAIVERFLAAFPEAEFVSKRTVDQSALVADAGVANPLEALTDRQRQVLEVAYHAGYFDSPRTSSGEDLAGTLDISSATFYQHVRKGSRKLLDELTANDS